MKPGIFNLFLYAGIVAFFFGIIQYLFPVPCKQPIAYSIGTLDAGFGISREAFLQSIQKAEHAWELSSGKDLFEYDQNSAFTVNLIYDSRQEKTNRAKTITTSLNQTSKTRDSVKKQYDNAYANYLQAQKAYDASVARYKADVKDLNEDVRRSNAAGGASSEEYDALQARQKALTERMNVLEQDRVRLNTLAAQVNAFADTESKIVQTYNTEVEKLNEEFGSDREFRQGEYTGNSIVIYEFTNAKDLLMVLEHEMGHALGIEHLPNPSSLMYYRADQKTITVDGPTKDDLAALDSQCKKTSWGIFLERIRSAYTGLALRIQ